MPPVDLSRAAQPTTADLTAPTESGLIAGSKVAGTAVFDLRGEHIGRIEDVVLGKVSGKVAYAVLSFGGFLGIGAKHYPLPWDKLRYSTELRGYVVDLDADRLRDAPVVEAHELPLDHDEYRRRVEGYWSTTLM